MTDSTVLPLDSTNFCVEEAQARFRRVQDLVHFVRSGLRWEDGQARMDLSPLVDAVAARFAQYSLMGWSDPSVTPEIALERSKAALSARAAEYANTFYFKSTKLSFIEVDEENKIPSSDDADYGTAAFALRMARANVRRAEERLIGLYCLADHNPGMTQDPKSGACLAYLEATRLLWQKHSEFRRNVLMFTIMVGGAELDQMRTELLDTSFSKHNSLVGYLTR